MDAEAAITSRFVGGRLDGEIVFLDRATNRLIHLTVQAVRVWEACVHSVPELGEDGATAGMVDDGVTAGAGPILAELERAGVVRRMDGRYIRVPVEWP